jgi:RNA polymerase sigma-70 factor (ECF subfamily)
MIAAGASGSLEAALRTGQERRPLVSRSAASSTAQEQTTSDPASQTRTRGTRNGLVRDTALQDEDRLLARARAGDEAAFSILAERYSTRLRRLLFRITRDCDAVQEALTRAWLSIGRFEGRARFYTWLTRIGINEAYNGMRRRPAETLELDDQVGERVPDWGQRPDEAFESREFRTAIDDALARLPLDYRIAVTLRDVEGLSTEEAAEVLDIGERALKSRLHRGRLALRAQLDGYFEAGHVE